MRLLGEPGTRTYHRRFRVLNALTGERREARRAYTTLAHLASLMPEYWREWPLYTRYTQTQWKRS